MKLSPENFVKVTIMALVGIFVLKKISATVQIPGLNQFLA